MDLDTLPSPRLCSNLGKKESTSLCVFWTLLRFPPQYTLNQIWTWKFGELKNDLLTWETSAVQDNSTTKFSLLRTNVNKTTLKTLKSSQTSADMSKATTPTLEVLLAFNITVISIHSWVGDGSLSLFDFGNLSSPWGSVFQGPILEL